MGRMPFDRGENLGVPWLEIVIEHGLADGRTFLHAVIIRIQRDSNVLAEVGNGPIPELNVQLGKFCD